jgi:hypothetical protein
MTPREAMNGALKDAIAHHLRPQGFTGSLPHLRRRSDTQIGLISFQYFSAGGSFVVEIADTIGLSSHRATTSPARQNYSPTPPTKHSLTKSFDS